jgi:peptidyl-prolyl cis-trans isomerase D
MAKRKPSDYFLGLIMVLLILGLANWGTNGISGTNRGIGTVGNKEISAQQYVNALRQQLQAFSQQVGSTVTLQQAQALGIDKSVLAQVVTSRTLDNEADQLGISVGDARVFEQIVAIPAFHGLDGKFDREAYRMTLDQNNLTEAEFEATLRDDVARSLLQGAVLGGLPEPVAYADVLGEFIGEQRSMTWAPVTAAALAAPVAAPTDAEVQTYFETNPDAYTSPEVRKITYVWLTPDMIQDSVAVDDQAVRDLYQERIAEYVQPERRLVERLVFGTEEQATEAKARIDAGETDFDALVVERGLDLSDVDLGDVSLDDLGPAGDAVFVANAGDVVGPFLSNLGPALFRMNAVLAAEEVTFEEAQSDLRTELANQRARRVISDSSDQIVDLMAGGATLEDLADRTDMQLGQIDWSVDVTEGVAAYTPFRTAAAAVEQGAYPEILELDDGGIFALRLDAVTPPAVKALDTVRDQVIADWTVSATNAAIAARAAEMATAITGGASFEDQGLIAVAETGRTRQDFVEETPPVFMTTVFDLEAGATTTVENGASTIVVRLDSIDPPDPQDPTLIAQKESFSQQAATTIMDDVFAVFAEQLQAATEININEAAVNALNAQIN